MKEATLQIVGILLRQSSRQGETLSQSLPGGKGLHATARVQISIFRKPPKLLPCALPLRLMTLGGL